MSPHTKKRSCFVNLNIADRTNLVHLHVLDNARFAN